tara:strand:+ start:605 stop:838 length:234 start_codon:yes stop_codon:yes gene_type:complete
MTIHTQTTQNPLDSGNESVVYKTPEAQRRASSNFIQRLKEQNYEEYRKRQNKYMRAYRLKLKLKKEKEEHERIRQMF